MRVWVWALVCKVSPKRKKPIRLWQFYGAYHWSQQAKACTRTHTQAQMHYLLLVSIDFKLTNWTQIGRVSCGTCFGLSVCVYALHESAHAICVLYVHIARAVCNCRSRLVKPASPTINNVFGFCCLTEWVFAFCSLVPPSVLFLIVECQNWLLCYTHTFSMNVYAKQKGN